MPAYFRSTVREFLEDDANRILGELNLSTRVSHSSVRVSTIISWERTIAALRYSLSLIVAANPKAEAWGILIEYEIPRRDRRIDVIILAGDLVIVLEFKTGDSGGGADARRQVENYALDLRDFHRESRGKALVPILVTSRDDPSTDPPDSHDSTSVKRVAYASDQLLHLVILHAVELYGDKGHSDQPDLQKWDESAYEPVPNIIEAAQMLFAGHSVRELSHAHADAYNLTKTTDLLVAVIATAQREKRKVICFVTGVPRAGKTLAGLNAVHSPELMRDARPAGAFLSGNGPLVKVISEGLARNHRQQSGEPIEQSRRRIRTFIQNVHSFLKEYRSTERMPPERVIVFDEAQRAWDATQVEKKFLQRATASERDEVSGLTSEPATILSIMDRFSDWAVLIALVGGGQEIHDGEAGLAEWGRSLSRYFSHWNVWASPEALEGGASVAGSRLFDGERPDIVVRQEAGLHLPVSFRSFRAEAVASWVNTVVGGHPAEALRLASDVSAFPIVLTRSLERAREWLRHSTRGLRRCGLLARSGALRLRAHGLEVSSGFRGGISFVEWFLAVSDDIRSSNALEIALTEFECQGLELDWCGLCWGDDFTWNEAGWEFRRLNGPAWRHVRKPAKQEFIRNKYRVLLTRAREGMVIWVPPGDLRDPTRHPARMDSTAHYLESCGATSLD